MSRLQHSVDTPEKTPSIAFEPPQYYQPQHPLFQHAEATFEKLVKGSPAPVKSIYIVLIKSGTLEPVGTISLHSSTITTETKEEVKKLLAAKHYELENPDDTLVLIGTAANPSAYTKDKDGKLILDPAKCLKVKAKLSALFSEMPGNTWIRVKDLIKSLKCGRWAKKCKAARTEKLKKVVVPLITTIYALENAIKTLEDPRLRFLDSKDEKATEVLGAGLLEIWEQVIQCQTAFGQIESTLNPFPNDPKRNKEYFIQQLIKLLRAMADQLNSLDKKLSLPQVILTKSL